jgi:protocatechuate 3,4-dioxygenase beta subunit
MTERRPQDPGDLEDARSAVDAAGVALTRRGALVAGAAGLAAVVLVGCSDAPPFVAGDAAERDAGGERDATAAQADAGVEPDAGAGSDAGVEPDAGSSDAGSSDAGEPTPQCLETEDNILGPFYRRNAPFRTAFGGEGEPLVVSGRVRAAGFACGALDGAVVDVWHADAEGAYDNDSPAFAHRGRVRAGADGTYAFSTILPGRYLNGPQFRPRHVHVRVDAPGHVLLTTQLYFEGDPFLDADAFVKPSLVRPLEGDASGWRCTFDIVLAKA